MPHRRKMLEHYASFILGKPIPKLSRKDLELARKNFLLKFAPIYFDPSKNYQQKERWVDKVFSDFIEYAHSKKSGLKLSWRLLTQIMSTITLGEVEWLVSSGVVSHEDLCKFYHFKGRFISKSVKQTLEHYFSKKPCVVEETSHVQKRRSRGGVSNWTRYVDRLVASSGLKLTPAKRASLDTTLKKIVLNCWFTNRARAKKLECIYQQFESVFGGPVERRPYLWWWRVVARTPVEELAKLVPKYVLEEYLKRPPRKLGPHLKEKLRQALEMY